MDYSWIPLCTFYYYFFLYFPKQFTVRGSQFFLKMCPPLCDWWCLPLRSCLCLVSLHVKGVSLSGGVRLSGLVCALSPFMWRESPWVVVSASPVLSVPCLPSSLCLVSLHLSPSCVSLSGGVRLSGLVCALSPFICLPSCEGSLPEWWCPPLRSCPVLSVPCLPSCVSLHVKEVSLSGGVHLSGLVFALSPFICLPSCEGSLPEWWCPPLRSCLCLVSLHLSPSCVSLSGGVRLAGLVCALSSFICLRSCVSLSGGVRLSGLVCALSSFICLPSCVSLSGGVRLAGLVCALSPFMCLPEWLCPPLRSCLCLVSLHLSPFMCLPEWWCPPLRSCLCLVSLHLSPFMCLPEWWCLPLRSCLCLVSLHLSPFICLPSFVSLSGGVRLSGLVCALSPFICLPSCEGSLPEWWCPPRRSCLCLVSLHLSPFMCLPAWWCPPRRSCLCLVSLHLSPWVVVSASPVLSVPCLPSFVSFHMSPWVVVSASPVLFVPCLPSFVYLHLSPFMCLPSFVSLHVSPWVVVSASPVLSVPCLPSFVSFHVSPWVVVSASPVLFVPCLPSFVFLHLSPFMCLPEWWCPPRRSCLCLVSVHLSSFMCLPEWWCPPLRSCLCLVSFHLSSFICLPEWWCPPRLSCLCRVSLHVSPWLVVSASPVLSVPCLPSCVSLFMCLPEWWCPPLRSCLCLVSLHLSPLFSAGIWLEMPLPHGMRPLAVSGRISQRKIRGDRNMGGRTAQKCAAIAWSWYKQYHADMEWLFGVYGGVIRILLRVYWVGMDNFKWNDQNIYQDSWSVCKIEDCKLHKVWVSSLADYPQSYEGCTKSQGHTLIMNWL